MLALSDLDRALWDGIVDLGMEMDERVALDGVPGMAFEMEET
jgi:hypothetical protein